jgi:membrane protease subunit HflK
MRFAAQWQAYNRSATTREVTRRRIFLETMSEVLPQIEVKYVVDSEQTGILPLLNLEGAQGGRAK